MADKQTVTSTHADTHPVIHRARGFWANYSKPIIFIGSAIIIIIGAWYAYQNFVLAPKEQKAAELIFPAENLFDKMGTSGFNKDSVNIVLNGGELDGNKVTGLLSVIKNYSGTDAANRANYMTGAAYLHIKEFGKAIKYLKEFDGNGVTQVQTRAYVMLGHAYAEQKNTSEALDYYKKAASVNEKDKFIASDALLIAATYADAIGNQKEAISLFKKLKEKFPTNASVQSGEVDKYLAKLGEVE
ncbi:MAG: tetratricopeptide repeat protein [Ferruginibacter sp.]